MIDRSLPIRCILGAMALAVLAPAASAQSLTSGTLHGVVRDSSGAAVAGAVVSATGAAGVTRTATASRSGRFEFLLLPPGEYDLRAEQLGYRPTRVLDVPVRPGAAVETEVVLAEATPPIDEVETVRWAGVPAAGFGAGQWFSGFEIAGLPERRRELGELARMSSVSSAELDVEGLPAGLTGLVVDGMAVGVARLPGGMISPLRSAALPLSGLAAAELVTAGADVEWSGYAGAVLNAHTRRASRTHQLRTFGSWAGAQAGDGPAAAASHSLQGGVVLSGPVIADTAGYVIGVEHWRLAAPAQAALAPGALIDGITEIAQDSYGVALGLAEPRVLRSEVVSAFGRLDWQLAADHGLSVRGNFAAVPSGAVAAPGTVRPAGFGTAFDGRDASVGAQLVSRLSDRLVQELRVGFESSTSEYRVDPGPLPTEGGEPELSSTLIVAGGLALGSDPGLPGSFGRTALRVQEALHWQTGDHRLKFGASADFFAYDQTHSYGRSGEFVFAGPDQFASGEGYFTQTTGPVRSADFRASRYGLFVQDTWTPLPGLELLLGLRYDLERLPTGDVALNEEWARRTGMLSSELDGPRGRLSPRFSFHWQLQQSWSVRGSAGIHGGSVDPALLGELLINDGSLEVRRGIGTLGGWPVLPDESVAPVQGNALTLMAPGFEAPRTSRGSFGVSRVLGAGTTLHVGGTFRRTEFLPRRDDLNLRQAPLAHDQHGRPVYGRLRHQGGLLAVENGSNRRFPGFDVVAAINADGWSEYLGGTVALERRAGERLDLFGSYTFSRTEDNWLAPRGTLAAQLSPFPAGLDGGDWTEGVSDLDVPHRAVIGAEVRFAALEGVRLAGIYRLESGAPFTPGFRDGVDANGDGSIRNDVAFIDRSVAGMDELLGSSACLQAQTGRFAARNSCRGSAVHSLDLRLGVGLFRIGGLPAELVIDGLNLIASEYGLPDRAVYLIDADGELVWDEAAGSVTVPLVANPEFGRSLISFTPARALRIGLRVNY